MVESGGPVLDRDGAAQLIQEINDHLRAAEKESVLAGMKAAYLKESGVWRKTHQHWQEFVKEHFIQKLSMIDRLIRVAVFFKDVAAIHSDYTPNTSRLSQAIPLVSAGKAIKEEMYIEACTLTESDWNGRILELANGEPEGSHEHEHFKTVCTSVCKCGQVIDRWKQE
jgi:hypothetical protein